MDSKINKFYEARSKDTIGFTEEELDRLSKGEPLSLVRPSSKENSQKKTPHI